ncbi:MAG: Ig-like domain-containing protein [Firmicutes bacterium]|nr:Ig-like domain-containing protein [Bacillota bacterium]
MRFYDKIPYYSYPVTTYSISTSPNGEAVDDSLKDIAIPSSRNTVAQRVTVGNGVMASQHYVDLKELPSSALSKLTAGKTYYLQIRSQEIYEGRNTYKRVLGPKGKIKITITKPQEMTMPSLDMGISYTIDTSTNPQSVRLYPTGDGTAQSLNLLLTNGRATSYEIYYKYYDRSGSIKTVTASGSQGSNLQIQRNDLKYGVSDVTYGVKLYYGSTFLGEKSVTQLVPFLPDLTVTNQTVTNGNVLVTAGTPVNLSNSEGLSTGYFYYNATKGTKFGQNQSSYAIYDVGANEGLYKLGYTYSGKDYFNEKGIYIGVKDTGDRSVSIGATSTGVTITQNGNATPTITATAVGKDWGTIDHYYWYMESVPDEFSSQVSVVKKKRAEPDGGHNERATINFAELFSIKGSEELFTQGRYVIRCEATSTANKKVSSPSITINVYRPVDDMQLIWNGNDVSGGGIALNKGESAAVAPEFTPKNAYASSSVYFTAAETDIADISASGIITAKSTGKTKIIATYNTGSKNIRKEFYVYVARTNYSLSIPSSYLTAEVGKVPYQGTLSTSGGFGAELKWATYYTDSYGGHTGSNLSAGTAFEGEHQYRPILEIYPDEDTAYPAEYDSNYKMYFYDTDSINVTVNDKTYGDPYMYYNYTNDLPVSKGSETYDKLTFYLPATDMLIDPNDEYMDEIHIYFDLPCAGEKPVKKDYLWFKDNVSLDPELALVSDGILEVTDAATAADSDPLNDSLTDFNGTFEAGKLYRCSMTIAVSGNAQSANGGKVYLADGVKVIADQKSLISASRSYANVWLYFRPNEDMTVIRGDVDMDGSVTDNDARLLLKYLGGTAGLSSAQRSAAMATDGDADVDMLDAIWILNNKK